MKKKKNIIKLSFQITSNRYKSLVYHHMFGCVDIQHFKCNFNAIHKYSWYESFKEFFVFFS